MDAMLDIEGLGKSFAVHQLGKRIKACEGIDISVAAGEFVGITGRSGSGKSTILSWSTAATCRRRGKPGIAPSASGRSTSSGRPSARSCTCGDAR